MKIFKLLICGSLLILLTTGCSITSESPEELIEKKPIYNENKKNLSKEINKLLPLYSSLTLPSNSSEVGKINDVDLNNDGIDELVAFEKKENPNENPNEVGFIVLSKNKDKTSYTNEDNHIQTGDLIEYANFYDLNGDGYKEIILLIKKGNKTNMNIYSFKKGEIKKIYTLNPTWIKDKEDLTDMKIKIDYIDEDEKLDILIINHNSKNSTAYASLLNFNEKVELIDSTEFSNVKNLSNLYITIGTISTEKIGANIIEKKGVILDIPIIQDNNYLTQIIYIQDGKMKKAFSDNEKNIKPYYIPIEDIDKDNIIEIPIVKGSGNTYTQKNSAEISWYKWNGKKDEKSGLVFISKIYYNYQYNYKMWIPNILMNNISIEQEYDGNNVLFKFYYYNTVNFKNKNLFTISVVSKNVVKDKKNALSTNNIILGETDEHSFILYENDEKELKKLKINTEALREYFSLIYD